jgi:hypothetical protein
MVMADDAASSRDTLSSTEPEIIDLTGQDIPVDEEQTDDGAADDATDTDDGADDDMSDVEPDVSDADRTQSATQETLQQVEVSIVGGEYSDVVSEKLRKAGVIDDVEDFNRYLAETGSDNLIQPGTYLLPLGADYDTIIEIITNRDDAENE